MNEKARAAGYHGPVGAGSARVGPVRSATHQHLAAGIKVQKTGHIDGGGTEVGTTQAQTGRTVAQHETIAAGGGHRQQTGRAQRQIDAGGTAAHVHIAAGSHFHVVSAVLTAAAQVGRPAQSCEPGIEAGEHALVAPGPDRLSSVEHRIINRLGGAGHQHVTSGGVHRQAARHQ